MSENNIVNLPADQAGANADAQENATAQTAEAPAATTNVPVQKPVEETVATAHDDFDWSVDKRNVATYSREEKEKETQARRQLNYLQQLKILKEMLSIWKINNYSYNSLNL